MMLRSAKTVELGANTTQGVNISETLLQGLRQEVVLAIKDADFPEELRLAIKDSVLDAFALLSEAKDAISKTNSEHFLGYTRHGSEITNGVVDRREIFDFATESFAQIDTKNDSNRPVPDYTVLIGPNQWPDHNSIGTKFRSTIESYLSEMRKTYRKLLAALEVALKLPDGTLLSLDTPQVQHRLKIVKYLPQQGMNKEEDLAQGVGAHQDETGWLTFVQEFDEPGLSVHLQGEERWALSYLERDSWGLNIGKAFEHGTAGLISATLHCVKAPSHESPPRHTAVFFAGIPLDTTYKSLQEKFLQSPVLRNLAQNPIPVSTSYSSIVKNLGQKTNGGDCFGSTQLSMWTRNMTEEQSTNGYEAEKEDSEWEYEYDETETESFYVTLEISAATEHTKLGTKKAKKPDRSPARSPQPTASPVAQDNAGPSESAETPAADAAATMNIDPALLELREDTSSPEPEDRIQILDLHTHNPLISYQDQLYSCEWTSTLGTDVLLTAPTSDFPHPVIREHPNVSVLAASSIKLMGRPTRLVPRHTAKEPGQDPTHEPGASLLPADSTSAPRSLARQNQARFLERLIAIKAKKGEKDEVTVHTQKVNQGSGWRSRRKADEANLEDAEEGDETTPQSQKRGKGTGGRPMGSRRLKGPRTAKGGLFRDYRPQLWDTPGADIRAGSSSTLTPESWDQLAVAGAGSGATTDAGQTPPIIISSTASAAPPLPIGGAGSGATTDARQTPPIINTTPSAASPSLSIPANGSGPEPELAGDGNTGIRPTSAGTSDTSSLSPPPDESDDQGPPSFS